MKSGYKLYLHISPTNKVYVGVTKQHLSSRFGKQGIRYNHNQYFFNEILKYGWDSFRHIVIQDGLTKEEAFELEKFYIKKFNTTNKNFGYNVQSGGGEGYTFNEEYCRKKSEMFKGRKPSEKCLEMLKKANTGRTISEETRKKLSEAHKGRIFSQEAREKISKAHLGRPVLPETRKKISISLTGREGKKVRCVETGEIYISAREASRKNNRERDAVARGIRRKKRVCGYHWEYIN